MKNIEFGIVEETKKISAYCDATGRPIYENETYLVTQDGVNLYYNMETLIKHFNLHRVTEYLGDNTNG